MVTVKSIRRIGAVAAVLPTGDHLIAPTLTMIFAPALMTTVFGPGAMPATVFFICLGIFQLIWIRVLLRSNNRLLLTVGVFGNLVSIVIYFVSLSGVTIFGVPPQNGGAFALIIKTLEAIYAVACVYVMKAKPA